MTREKFDEIWGSIIEPIFGEMESQRDIGHEGIYIRASARKKVYSEYQKQKTFLKLNYMQNPKTHLDRHKIAACMLYAIVKVQPVVIKKKTIWEKFICKNKLKPEYSLLNEYLGFYTALSIVESFSEYQFEKDKKANVTLQSQRKRITLPRTTNDEDYVYNTCLDLYFSKKKNKVNILTLANVFFLLEVGDFEPVMGKKQKFKQE